jgi:hypothetical protein
MYRRSPLRPQLMIGLCELAWFTDQDQRCQTHLYTVDIMVTMCIVTQYKKSKIFTCLEVQTMYIVQYINERQIFFYEFSINTVY